jgi:acyl-CoA thioesterase I
MIASLMMLLSSNRSPDCSSCGSRRALRAAGLAIVLASLAALPLSAPASPAPTADHARHTLLVLGDSISAALGVQRDAGWVALLEQRLRDEGRPWRVINASMSGETTGGGSSRLPQLLAAHSPEVVLIELGGNDALRGYPLDHIRDNLVRMTEQAQAAGADVLIAEMQIPPNYDPRNAEAFRTLFGDVAAAHGAELIPFLMQDVALEPGMMQPDGIHPTAAAQPAMLEAAWPAIDRVLSRAAARAERDAPQQQRGTGMPRAERQPAS